MRILLDTNALIDLFVDRYPEQFRSMRLIVSLLAEGKDKVLVPATSLVDASYIIQNNSALRRAIPSKVERATLAQLMRASVLQSFDIASIDDVVCRRAQVNSTEPDFEDAVIEECAAIHKCDAIVSSDTAAFAESTVPRLSPRQCAYVLANQA